MESIITSHKSVADIKDPLIKSIVADVSSILKAELSQAILAYENPAIYSTQFESKVFTQTAKPYSKLSNEEKDKISKLKKSLFITPNLKSDLFRLGVDLKKGIPASRQIDYQKTFGHLKGKSATIENLLDQMGSTRIVPFVTYPDPDVNNLVKQIKHADKEGKDYADYLHLLDKPKLIELYQKEIGNDANPNALFKTQLNEKEITKIRRAIRGWELSPPKPQYPKYQNRYLRLKVTRVKCVDETEHEGPWPFSGEGIANDRIDLAAVSIAPNGEVKQFGPQVVSDNFEDRREFAWNQEIVNFDLLQMGAYPMNFGATVTIAEIDYGTGFANTMNDIFNGVKGVIVEVLSKIGEVIGGVLGSSEAGKIVGKIVGELVVLGLGELVNIVKRAVQDDVFSPQALTIQLESRYSSPFGVQDKYPGPFTLPEEKLIFNDYGGSYEVYCAWELIREAVQ